MRRTWRNILSLLLAFAMIVSLGATGIAEPETTPAEEGSTVTELPFEKVDNDIISERLPSAYEPYEEAEPPYADDELVRVSIVLDGQSAIDAGYAPQSAGAYRSTLRAQQDAMAARISDRALDGAALDVVWNITLAGNIISAYVPYGKIENIRNVIGVQDVFVETQYFPTEDEVENSIATEMTGATKAWNLGYTGAGSKIAVVDTGLDWDHQSFDPAAFQYAIDELNEGRETPITLMTAADVAAVWDQLNAAGFINSVDGVYLNAKVPFAVNYVDRDLDVTHDNDSQGEHGSHVAGIAAANKYIANGDTYLNALDYVHTQGEAPDAQLLIMKVFGKGGGAYDSDYMIAVEDAMTLGCDAVNLSLGSSSPGFNTNATYAETLDKLVQFGLVWANSAGNNYSWTNPTTGDNKLYWDDVNYQTGGSPATYNNTLSVASVDNTTGSISVPMELINGTKITFSETSGYGNEPLDTIAGEHAFIMLLPNSNGGSNGDEETQFAALAEVLEGKVAVCWRGGSSFYVKANAAVANGAVGTIVANNAAGVINMNLTGYQYSAPAVSITQNDGTNMLYDAYYAGGMKEANGVQYVEGTIIIPEGVSNDTGSVFQQMSDFSSWGGNGALTMKPEITAPGGNILSVNGMDPSGTGYELMSGTSMASPQVAGLVAVLKQYIRETGLVEKLGGTLTERAIAQSLLMSTSEPLFEAATDYYWSIMKQGSGLADVNSAITSRTFIQITDVPESAPASAPASIADGKVKVELGEVYNGFTTSFDVTNFSDEPLTLDFNGEFFTQLVSDYYRTEYTTPIYASISWTVNGVPYEPADLPAYDFNGDNVVNASDPQYLLNWCADETLPLFHEDLADLDGDGNVDTHDAKLAFELINVASVELAAGETAHVVANVAYDLSAYDIINGNYVEGFLFVSEGMTADGAMGVRHSIPVFGYNGCFTDATMFDRGSHLEYKYGFGDGDAADGWYPYMYYTAEVGENALDVETFIIQYYGDSGLYYFGGNPIVDDEEYMPERNAMNARDMLAGVQFTQIRNAGAGRFFLTDADGNIVTGSEILSGASSAAYYYRNQQTWQNTVTAIDLNYVPAHAQENDVLTAHYQLAPEYYVDPDGTVRWDELGPGSEMTIPFVIDNTAPEITSVLRDTNIPPAPEEDELPIVGPGEDEEIYDDLIITATENQYVAACAVFNDQGELLDYQGAALEAAPGEEMTYTFDLKEMFDGGDVYPYLLIQVYDYASNLSTYKINFKAEEEGDAVTSVTVDPAEATIIGTGSLQLSADVRPWGIDDTVIWTSSDETVATVDEDGIVTGVAEGECTITATSVLDDTMSGTCVITVMFIDKELSGIVWDEGGQVWFSDFNLKTIPDYTKLNEEPLKAYRVCTATYDGSGVLYAATFDSDEYTSTLCTVDETDWSVTPVGAESAIGFMDICGSPNGGENMLLGVYGKYLLLIDKSTGQYVGAFNTNAASNLVGIAYEGSYDYSAYNYGMADYFFLVDAAGNLYEGAILNQDTMNGYWFRPQQIGNLGYTCDTEYFQSLYWDGESLFWSCFNNGANKVDMIMVDHLWTDGSIYQAGSFAKGVWPVGGLFEQGVGPETFSAEAIRNDLMAAVTDEDFLAVIPVEETEDELPVIEDEEPGTIAPVGGLDVAPADRPGDEIEKVGADIVVDITAQDFATNGKVVIDYDPATITLTKAIPYGHYTGIVDQTEELGHYVLAWVDLDGIEADGLVLQLKFSTQSNGVVTITTYEEGERDADSDETLPLEEQVFLGNPAVDPHSHVYALERWDWADDYKTAVAVFACEECGATKTVEAVVSTYTTSATCEEDALLVYHADAEFLGETYSDEQTVVIGKAIGHAYGEPEWTWNEDFTAATATFTCANCGDKVEVEATIDEEIVTEAMPHIAGLKNVTATVVFEGVKFTDTQEVEIPELPCACAAFEDMPEYGTVEHAAIEWAFTHDPQITAGIDATHFGGDRTVTRAQAMTFLWNGAGRPDPVSTENPFTDVKDGKYYTNAILWAYNRDPRITNGISADKFGINNTCSRAQIITFLWNALGRPEPTIENPYSDVKAGKYYTNAAIWAYEVGIERGEDGVFGINVDCTRMAIVTYLYRYYTGEGLLT